MFPPECKSSLIPEPSLGVGKAGHLVFGGWFCRDRHGPGPAVVSWTL